MSHRPVRVILLAALALAACGTEAPPAPAAPPSTPSEARVTELAAPAPAPPTAVSGTPSAAAQGAPPTDFVGVVTTTEAVDVAPVIEAALISLAVRPGDVVTAGQVLAKLDPRGFHHDVEVAKATLAEAVAARRAASVDYKDAGRILAAERRAYAAGVTARRAIEDASANRERAAALRDRADAAVAEARARVTTFEVLLSDAAIRAPFDGVIALRYREVGDTAGPRNPVVRINKRDGLRLRFAVPPETARALHTGQRVTAHLDTLAAPVTATVDQIAPEVDAPSRLVFVDARLDGATADLQPGLAAHVRLD